MTVLNLQKKNFGHREVRLLAQYDRPWHSGFSLCSQLLCTLPGIQNGFPLSLLSLPPKSTPSTWGPLQLLRVDFIHQVAVLFQEHPLTRQTPFPEFTNPAFLIQPLTFCWDLLILLLIQMRGNSKTVFGR